uniref:EF-hand domain-containing protein n=1 Tax=Oryza meridionalis TaxID=40149 RepID=A0A0E0CR40_9ORYZ
MGLVLSCGCLCRSRSRSLSPPPPSDRLDVHPSFWKWVTEPERGRVFRYVDTDGDGHLSAAEIREFYGCGKAKETVAAADRQNGDGFLSIEELRAVMGDGDSEALQAVFDEYDEDSIEELRAVMEDGDSEALQAVFNEYDEDGDGVVTAEELRRAMHRLGGVHLTAEECAEIVAAADSDGDGVISFDEFKAMMAKYAETASSPSTSSRP